MTAGWAAAHAEATFGAPRPGLTLATATSHQPGRRECLSRPPASRELALRPESVKTARDFTASTLRGWGMAWLAGDAVLVVSELVTNALRHNTSSHGGREDQVRLRLLAQDPYLMCLVADPGYAIPRPRNAATGAETGRGLQVVDSCCSRWGWHLLDDGGKVVWALLPRE
jgi:anti-sigma regulatory factor (Ser/Thr protein kinase)